MSALSVVARREIKDSGLSIAAYVRWAAWIDGKWHGDSCGCTDDRCAGFHHDETEECRCLPVLIDRARRDLSTGCVDAVLR